VLFLFDGAKLLSQGIALSKGMARSIMEGHIKFLEKESIEPSNLESTANVCKCPNMQVFSFDKQGTCR